MGSIDKIKGTNKTGRGQRPPGMNEPSAITRSKPRNPPRKPGQGSGRQRVMPRKPC